MLSYNINKNLKNLNLRRAYLMNHSVNKKTNQVKILTDIKNIKRVLLC